MHLNNYKPTFYDHNACFALLDLEDLPSKYKSDLNIIASAYVCHQCIPISFLDTLTFLKNKYLFKNQ